MMSQNVGDPLESMWVLKLTSDSQAVFENALPHYDGQGGDVPWGYLDGQLQDIGAAASLHVQTFHEATTGDFGAPSGSSAGDNLPATELSNDNAYTSLVTTPMSLPFGQAYQATPYPAESSFDLSTHGSQEAHPAL